MHIKNVYIVPNKHLQRQRTGKHGLTKEHFMQQNTCGFESSLNIKYERTEISSHTAMSALPVGSIKPMVF